MLVSARAKLNLNLHLLPKKVKGLFQVRYINCELSLSDYLTFELKREGITVRCTDTEVPVGEGNLVFQAALALKNKFDIKQGIDIAIDKHIPVRSGLGGGSADAGSALKALVKLWEIDVSQAELLAIARSIGMDVCYSTVGGIAVVENDGSLVSRLAVSAPRCTILGITPAIKKPSTAWSFSQLNEKSIGSAVDTFYKLQEALNTGDMYQFYQSLHNDFEVPLSKHFPALNLIKADLKRLGARATILCGAGLAMAGFFDDSKSLEYAKDNLAKIYKNIWEAVII